MQVLYVILYAIVGYVMCLLGRSDGQKCRVSDGVVASCKNISVSASETARVVIIVNVCHHPKDVVFTIQAPGWQWKHTFINKDESQPVQGPGQYTLLRVQIYRPDNATFHIWANFIVDGMAKPVFLNNTFHVDAEEHPCLPVTRSARISDFVALIVFAILCVLITIAVTIFLVCMRSKCTCTCPRRHGGSGSLGECKLLSSVNSERPLSSSSLHSSSHGSGSYEDPDEDFFASRRRKARPNQRHPRKVKSLAVVRNSVYSDSVVMEELPAISENLPNFGSLGRNFRSKKSSAPHWIPSLDEEYISDLSIESLGQVPAQDILNLESGTSQPHYSATKFHSFRAKKVKKSAKFAEPDLITPESPLLLPKEKHMVGNGCVMSKKLPNGEIGQGFERKNSSSQHLLNAEVIHREDI